MIVEVGVKFISPFDTIKDLLLLDVGDLTNSEMETFIEDKVNEWFFVQVINSHKFNKVEEPLASYFDECDIVTDYNDEWED